MSTGADVCPYCLRFEGFAAARESGTRFCPSCGTDWQAAEAPPEAAPHWREDSVVLPLPDGWPQGGAFAAGETGPLPALSSPRVRDAAPLLRLTPPPAEAPAPWDVEGYEALPGPDTSTSGAPFAEAARWGLTPEPTDPAPPPPPPEGSPWLLVGGAAAALAMVVIGLNTLSDVGFSPSGAVLPADPAPVAAVVTAPPSAAAAPTAAPVLPELPTPRSSPERRSAAVKEHIERALDGQPETTQAEVGVRVDEGVAYLVGAVDSAETLALVTRAAGQTFGVKAVDNRALRIERRPPPVHVVAPGETLSGVARRLYGSGGQWRRIYEMNPGIDPNLIRVGQPLSLPPSVPGSTP